MSHFLLLPDGYGSTKFLPVYEGLTGVQRMSIAGFHSYSDPELQHYTTHGLADIKRAHAFLGAWIERMEGPR